MKEFMLILHFIGLAMGIGTSFAFMFLGIVGSKMERGEALKFSLNTFVLSKMGYIGLTLLIISGIYLIIPYWDSLFSYPLLVTKLVLVLLLIVLLWLISKNVNKIKKENSAELLKRMRPLGFITLLTGIAIVILAVFVFN